MFPFPDNHHRQKLIRIVPIDPSGLNSITTTAKSTSTVPGVSAATIAQAWSIQQLNYDLGQPPMTVVGDAIVVVVGSQPWVILRFLTSVQTVSANGIVQGLSYANYFQEQIEVA